MTDVQEPEAPPERLALLDHARIRVLVVPVHPIQRATFERYVQLLQKFSVVSLADLTPPDPTRGSSEFNSQRFTEGHLYFDFCTSYNREHTSLETLAVHRQVLGAIGIMHCGQCPDLRRAYKGFTATAQKYPTVMVTRCFAFDPTETTPDDTRGLIMIPNVGQLGFYMSTMISDFASELLTAFGGLAKALAAKPMIASPTMLSPAAQAALQQQQHGVVASPGTPSGPPGPSTADTSRPGPPQASTSAAAIPTLSTTPAAVSSPSAASGTPLQPALLAAAPSSAGFIYHRGLSTVSDGGGTAADLGASSDGRNRRRTPARVQKLTADLYLLAGWSSQAVTLYQQAIEALRANGDLLWLGVALDGLVTAQVLQQMAAARVGPESVLAREFYPNALLYPASAASVFGSTTPGLRAILAETPDRLREGVAVLAKALPAAQGAYPLLLMEMQLRLARLVTDMVLHNFDDALAGGGGFPLVEPPKATMGASVVEAVSSLGGGTTAVAAPATRSDAASWLMRCWASGVDSLTAQDQLLVVGRLAAAFRALGWARKEAFFLVQYSVLVRPLLQGAAGGSWAQFSGSSGGILAPLDRLCRGFRLDVDATSTPTPPTASRAIDGWPELQLAIVNECISLTDALGAPEGVCRYASLLLRRLQAHLTPEQQLLAARRLQTSTVQLDLRAGGPGADRPAPVELVVCRAIRAVPPAETLHIAAGQASSAAMAPDPFIYNPGGRGGANSAAAPLTVAAGDAVTFEVVLSNPFAFDVDVQSLKLVADSDALESRPQSTTLPAQCAAHVVLVTGVPQRPGPLIVRGCSVRMLGGVLRQTVFPQGPAGGLELRAVAAQPLLCVEAVVPGGALYLLEGQTAECALELVNVGSLPVEWASVAVQELGPVAADADRTAAAANRGTGPAGALEPDAAEIYEADVHERSLRACWLPEFSSDIVDVGGQPFSAGVPAARAHALVIPDLSLQPGERRSLKVCVFGKMGTSGLAVRVTYARTSDAAETRSARTTVLMTVARALPVSNFDILQHTHARDAADSASGNDSDNLLLLGLPDADADASDEQCLVTLDVHNAHDVAVQLHIATADRVRPHTTLVAAGRTKQLLVPMRRLLLPAEALEAPIPASPHRQFVLGRARRTPMEARLERELFWYREALLGSVKAPGALRISWETAPGADLPSSGVLNLRTLALTRSMLDMLAVARLALVPRAPRTAVPLGEPVALVWRVESRSAAPERVILRIVALQDLQNGQLATHLEQGGLVRFGAPLQTVLPELAPRGAAEYALPVCFLSSGVFSFAAHVESVDSGSLVRRERVRWLATPVEIRAG